MAVPSNPVSLLVPLSQLLSIKITEPTRLKAPTGSQPSLYGGSTSQNDCEPYDGETCQ